MEAKIFTNIMDIASCDEKTVDFFSFVTSSRSLLVIKSLIVIFMFLHVLRITIWRIQQKQLRSKRIFFISHCCNFAPVIKSIFAQINYTQFICWKALKNWKKLLEIMSNKRKLENSTFGPKIYIFQHDLFSLSAFFTELHRIANCLLEDFKLAKLSSELDSLFREQND